MTNIAQPQPPAAASHVPNIPVWNSQTWPNLPALTDQIEADVCVVGLGGSGLSCIGELLRLGQRVVGIDASQIGGGAAGRNGGFLLAGAAAFYHQAIATYGHDRALQIYRLTLAELDRMSKETPQAIRRVGSLRIASSPEELQDCTDQLRAMRADQLPVDPYAGPEGRGLLIPTDGAFHPMQRCQLLAQQALAAGTHLFEHTPAISFSNGAVICAQGSIRCRHTIVAVDGNLERLFPQLSGRVRTARLQMLACAPTNEIHVPRPVYRRWGYDYWQQLPDGRIAVGGFRDYGGAAEWTDRIEPTQRIQEALEQLLREELGVQSPITHRWAASVGYAERGLPIVEEMLPNVWAIGAYNGTGNVIGALCGRGIAQRITQGRSQLLAPFL